MTFNRKDVRLYKRRISLSFSGSGLYTVTGIVYNGTMIPIEN